MRAADGGIDLTIADTGIGISSKHIDLVMEPFKQVASAFSRTYEGTGLGLPLVKGLVELHDGSMKLESNEGEGTTVTVHLPASRIIGGPDKAIRSQPGARSATSSPRSAPART